MIPICIKRKWAITLPLHSPMHGLQKPTMQGGHLYEQGGGAHFRGMPKL